MAGVLSVITIIDSESIEMIDGRGPNVCVAISTIGVQSRFQGSLHPGRVNGSKDRDTDLRRHSGMYPGSDVKKERPAKNAGRASR